MANAAAAMQTPSPPMAADDSGAATQTPSPSPATPQVQAGNVFCLEDHGDGSFSVWQDDGDGDMDAQGGGTSGDTDGDAAEQDAQTFDSLEKAVAGLYKLAQANPTSGGDNAQSQFASGFGGPPSAGATPITTRG